MTAQNKQLRQINSLHLIISRCREKREFNTMFGTLTDDLEQALTENLELDRWAMERYL